MFGWRTETDGTKAIAVRSYVPKSMSAYRHRHSPHALHFLLGAPTTLWAQDQGSITWNPTPANSSRMALCPCISKGRTGLFKFSWSALEQSTRNKRKPSSSNPMQLGYTKAEETHFIRNGNRNSLNLWIRDISLSSLPWYWLCVQRPFTLGWLGFNCCGFGSTWNAEPSSCHFKDWLSYRINKWGSNCPHGGTRSLHTHLLWPHNTSPTGQALLAVFWILAADMPWVCLVVALKGVGIGKRKIPQWSQKCLSLILFLGQHCSQLQF